MSVSLCPHAWQQIVKLGGHDLHELVSPEAHFLDIHEVQNDTDLLAVIVDWAVSEKFAKRQQLWRAWRYDLETEEWRCSDFDTQEEANKDAVFSSDEWEEGLTVDKLHGPDGGPIVELVSAVIGSRALAKLTGMRSRGPKDGDATDAVIMAWAMEQLPSLSAVPVHGLWWNEKYDPDTYSAPRGGIIPSFVDQWTAATVNLDEIEDVEEPLDSERVVMTNP
ncbi:MAG: hypothetical protein E6Q98_01565 [Rhodospirillaceae bacterium]|nr:MAG: hypothetical protein E6Q98_01565 [Rhodospirillaceae bacterium]